MARIISTSITPVITAVVQTVKTDGSVLSKEFKKDDVVSDLRYIDYDETVKITGRVSDIKYDIKPTIRSYSELSKLRSNFANDVVMTSVDVDSSTEYNAKVTDVSAKEIVEDEGVENVKKMKYFLKFAADFAIKLTDGVINEFSLAEGDDLKGVTYLSDGDEVTIDGKLVAMKYNASLKPTDLVLLVNGRIKTIEVLRLKNVAEVITPVTDNASITDAITAATDGFVSVGIGAFTQPVAITKDVVLVGNKAGISGTNKARTGADESVIEGAVTVSNGAKVTIDGFTLTADALIDLTGAAEVNLVNCIIKDVNPTAAKSYLIKNADADTALINIKNCFFGKNSVDGNKKFYNLFELSGALKDGSTFENNYFEKGCSNHNDINVYKVEENAVINIIKNTWEYSANAIRVGVKGAPTTLIQMIDNTYIDTDAEYPEYAGLFLVQPYGKSTTDMSKVTIKCNGTVFVHAIPGALNQLYYKYAGSGDMQFNEFNIPTIIVDDVVVEEPIPANNNG